MFDLSFTPVARTRPFALVAPGFVAVDEGAVGGTATVLAAGGPRAPYAAVELRVDGARGEATAGLATASGDHVLVRWSAARSRLSIEVRVGGRTTVLRRRRVTLRGGFGLAFALCENQVTALVDSGAGWRPVLTERRRVAALVDLRREAALVAYRYAWSRRDVRVSSVRAGVFGMTGVRDPQLVQHADGRPYVRDGRCWMTWTCAGLGFFQQAHWSVWSFDPRDPADQRLEAHLFSRRGGMVLGDHAGQLVRDGRRWRVMTSAWGDFEPGSVHVRHASTTADLLQGVHVLDTEPLALPTPHATWDPAFTRVDGRWYVGFVASPSQEPFRFHPALARTDADDPTEGLALVGEAAALTQCEGTVLARVDGEVWLLTSDKDRQGYPVFDLSGREHGRVDAPYLSNIPHPTLVPAPGGGWWLVTFDGTPYAREVLGYGTHGDRVVMRAD